MIQVRSGVFETNSSSTHVLIVDRDDYSVGYDYGEIDWDKEDPFETITKIKLLPQDYQDIKFYAATPKYYGRTPSAPLITTQERLDYLWTAIVQLYMPREYNEGDLSLFNLWKDIIKQFLPNTAFVIPAEDDWDWGVDHVQDLEPFIKAAVQDQSLVGGFLLNDRSVVYIGGDETPGWESWFMPYSDADGAIHKTPFGSDMYYYVKGN